MEALTITPDRSMKWAEQAACLSEVPDLFFPIGASGPPEHLARAKAVCAECPVRAACLSYALETKQEFGIWGGLTDDERRRMLRARRIRKKATRRP